VVERAMAGQGITLILEDRESQSVISGHCLPVQLSLSRPSDRLSDVVYESLESPTVRQVKMEIARLVLESAGASLEIYPEGQPGFTIRLPKPSCNEILA
jgi:hypothetical protein